MKNENIICCSCGAVVKNRKAFALGHAKMHSNVLLEQERIIVYSLYGKEKVDSLVRQYQEQNICVYDMRPIDISKYLQLLGVKRSSKEERATDRYKAKYLKSIQLKYGNGITNVSQAREVQLKKEGTFGCKFGSYEEYLANCRRKMAIGFRDYREDERRVKGTKQKIRAAFESKYGVSNASQIPFVRERISMAARKRMSALKQDERQQLTKKAREAIPHRWDKATRLETWVREGLERLGYDVEMHKRLKPYSIDIVIDGKIALEIQGDVYHANPRKYKASDTIFKNTKAKEIWERDARKKIAIEQAGFKFMELWEDEIRRNKTRMSDFLKEKGFINQKQED